MNKRAMACAAGFALLSPLTQASTTWSWSFSPATFSISDPSTSSLLINIEVKNDATSSDSIELGTFLLNDGSLPNSGILLDAQGRPVLTLTLLAPPQASLAPGEQLTYTVATTIASSSATLQDAIAHRDVYTLNPNYYVRTGPTVAWLGATATQPLQISFAPVPEPSTAWLSAYGALVLLAAPGLKALVGRARRR